MSMRGGLIAYAKLKHASIEAVVTRADGTVEDYGVVAEFHNPRYYNTGKGLLRRLLWYITPRMLRR